MIKVTIEHKVIIIRDIFNFVQFIVKKFFILIN